MSARPPEPPVLDTRALTSALAQPNAIQHVRELLDGFDTELAAAFSPKHPIEPLVQARAAAVDALLRGIWQQVELPEHCALVAVGGFGRGELHPASDIDILILLSEAPSGTIEQRIERFLTMLWDIGLEVGHSVRTPDECRSEAEADVTIATALMESRLLIGNPECHAQMQALTSPDSIWPARDFFTAKMKEQRGRHRRFNDSAYRLEPNIKEGPGGLRDIQNIAWVTQRHFQSSSLSALASHGFLTEDEFQRLAEGRQLLWKIRFALHLLFGRREERLLFDAQLKLAKQFGYSDSDSNLAVEQFMQTYYRTVMELSRLNEMLLELFEEELFEQNGGEPEPLNERFQLRNGIIEICHDKVFEEQPSALLEIFHLLQQRTDIKGVSPSTIRCIRRDRHLIDDEFRQQPQHRELFMQILREPRGVTHEFRRMNRYGVLARYLPAFGQITGRMQFDLFHAYTVDEHTLMVLSNLRRFALPRYDEEFPVCSKIMQALPKPEIAYLAGLFHDIAKGRGGDHSELGAEDAEVFCLEHGLSNYDARLVAWLVRHHLLLSVTAQKKDIADPEVINTFAGTVGDHLHLDYLYLLTVADVRGTNPELWNSWKARLFRDLYEATHRALNQGLENPLDREELIKETKDEAIALLASQAVNTERVLDLWNSLNDEYFLQHVPGEIAWHTRSLLSANKQESILLDMRRENDDGGTSVFLAGRDDSSLFGQVTAALEQLGLTVVAARIVVIGPEQVIHTYTVLEADGSTIDDPQREQHILATLQQRLNADANSMRVQRRTPRQMRIFTTEPRISFSVVPNRERTAMEVVAQDMPGLLSRIGSCFDALDIRLQNAKIATIGERAEDVFFMTTSANAALTPEEEEQLRSLLEQKLAPNS
ncbi:MAG: [protein-PII] uridylyltransferase [Gammaproteobacteria bacterium]|nr:[protein-PII] uridylyltransferase [Gammaproteobacteria bacterium]